MCVFKNLSKQITKSVTNILSIFAVALLILVSCMSPVFAEGKDVKETQTLNVDVGIDRSISVPLTLKADKPQFYLCGNFGPGDTLKGSVVFNNTCSETAQISLNNVIKNAPTNTDLLEYITVDISVNNEPIYKDSLKSLVELAESLHTSNPDAILTTWIDVEPYRAITMDIECSVSKFDVDNAFQNAILDTQWVFNARADVPDDPDEPEEPDPEEPGEPDVPSEEEPEVPEESTPQENTPVTTGQQVGFIAILLIVCISSILIAIFFSKKKK